VAVIARFQAAAWEAGALGNKRVQMDPKKHGGSSGASPANASFTFLESGQQHQQS
jgi:hypothetical protein